MRRLPVAASAVALAAMIAQPALAAGGFTVSGKSGPFIRQVASRHLGDSQGAGGAMALAADAVNVGQFQTGRLRMPQTQARVKALLDRIEANWPYPKGEPVQVIILGLDQYNAYSLPDGSIVVALGLLDHAKSDDEVAFVLAHELGHLRLGHFAQNARRGEAGDDSSRLTTLLMVGGAAAGVASGRGLSLDATTASQRAEATQDLLHFINNSMVEPAHSRAQEDEADALGFDLAEAAPYAADAASARVFDTVQADESNRAALTSALNASLKTELGKAVTARSALRLATGDTSGLKMGLLKGAGRVALGTAAGAQGGGPKHRSPEDRKRGIAAYSTDAYPAGLPLRDEQTTWLDEVRGSGEYAQARTVMLAVRQAMKQRADGDYAGAESALAPADRTRYASAPLVLNERARVRDDMGDLQTADQDFRLAHASPDQTVDGYIDHARMLYRRGQDPQATQVIGEGIQRFNNDDKPFIALEIAIARKDGDTARADGYHQRCLAYNDPGLKKDCDLAAGDSGNAKTTSGPRIPGGLGGISGAIGGFRPF